MNQSKRGARVGLVIALLTLASGLTATAVGGASSLDRYVERQMRKARLPGLATAIVVVSILRGP